jgi:hypothetical protein
MKHRLLLFLGLLVTAVGLLAATVQAQAEEFSLRLKYLDPPSRSAAGRGEIGADFVLRRTQPQYFFMQITDKKSGRKDPQAAAFAKIVKKELDKYVAEQPFRAVVKLGGEDYAFVLDKKDEKSTTYDRLYFDSNHNGDLTDDKPIDLADQQGSAQYSVCAFPRVNVTLNVGGAKIDYAFFLTAYVQSSGEFKYATFSLNSAAYREGEVVLDGKRHTVILLDHNSNGLFNDEVKIVGQASEGGRIYSRPGDSLLIDFDLKTPRKNLPYTLLMGDEVNYVSKSLCVNGRFYQLKVSPSGDKITLSKASAPVGYVTSLHDGFNATLYGGEELGFLKVVCGKSTSAAVPAGDWKLVSYTIDRTVYTPEGAPEAMKEKPKENSLLGVLTQGMTGATKKREGPQYTGVSCAGGKDTAALKVEEGKTLKMPFGPPYKAVVTARKASAKQAQLSLSLVGKAGEVCTNMMVSGDRPPAPKFTINTPKGETVSNGVFKYG